MLDVLLLLLIGDSLGSDGTRNKSLVLAMGESKGLSDAVKALSAVMSVTAILLTTQSIGVSGFVG